MLFSQAAYAASPAWVSAPEISSASTAKTPISAKKFIAVAAHPLAVDAGYQILKQGGGAVDAAIAMQMVLTLVEPQSSGIGGGGLMLYADAKQIQAFDGRETAPAAAHENLFQTRFGWAMSREAGMIGGRSVGVPGVLRMLELAHQQHGKLPWASLFVPAITLAEKGFAISPRLHAQLNHDSYLQKDPQAARYFFDPQQKSWAYLFNQQHLAWPVGHRLHNPALANTFKQIAAGGADAFYLGQIAKDIEAKVKNHPDNPGLLTAQDIAAYRAKLRPAICSDYRQWTICGMPPPSSGGVAIAQILGMLQHTEIAKHLPQHGAVTAQAVHLFSEASRLAYADRNRYLADSDFVSLPGQGVASLIAPEYLKQRASLIGEKSLGVASPGKPAAFTNLAVGQDKAPERPSTSHLSVVDADGAAVSLTSSLEDAFGARQMVDGFLLNNELTDFSFVASDADGPVANRVQAGKRPRSSMSPTMVFDKSSKQLLMVIGSPGGAPIINYVAKVLVATLDWQLSLQEAINLPNFGSINGPTGVEAGRFADSVLKQLRAKGHSVYEVDLNSGLHGVMRVKRHGEDVWVSGVDPRREGQARGE